MTVSVGGERGGGAGDRWAVPPVPGAVLEQMPAGVIVAEVPGGRVVFQNRHAERIWALPTPAPAGTAEYSAWQGSHPDGRPYEAEEWPLARAVLYGETVEAEEIHVRQADGQRGVIRVNAARVRDERAGVTVAVATFYDVTAERRHEVARRLLAEAGSTLALTLEYETTLSAIVRLAVPLLADWCGVYILGEDGRVSRVAVEHADPARRAVSARLAERYPTRLDAGNAIGRVLREGRSELVPEVTDAHLRELAQDEERLDLLRQLGMRSAMLVPLLTRGRTIGCLAFYTTQSGRRYGPEDLALAEELGARAALAIDNARLFEESQAANRAKSDFLAVVSHELRTPLTEIIGYAELLELGIPEPVTELQHEQVQRIASSARHLLTLIEEILTVVSVEAGRAKVIAERVRLGELLDRVVSIVGPSASEKGLGLKVEADAPEAWVVVDAGKVTQILLNLLTNAVKFTPAGEVALRAGLAPDALRLTVSDTGIGMTEAHRARAFEPFWQAEEAVTRQAGGTGLGLTVTRRLVVLLGGEVEVESEPGRGSTFTVRLPLPMRGGAAARREA